MRRNSAHEIRNTAPPPTPLNSATICGIAVIFTWRAAGTPTAVPSATPSAISPQLPSSGFSSVAIDRDRHADGGDAVAAHGGGRPGEPAQALDEQREGDDVEDVEEAPVCRKLVASGVRHQLALLAVLVLVVAAASASAWT